MLCSKQSVQGRGVRSSSGGVGEGVGVEVEVEDTRVEELSETAERGAGTAEEGLWRRRSGNCFGRGKEDGGGIRAEDLGPDGGFIRDGVCGWSKGSSVEGGQVSWRRTK